MSSPSLRDADAQLRQNLQHGLGQLRQDCVNAVMRHPIPLHLSPQPLHDRPGWYTALDDDELARLGIPVNAANLAFPVPVDCLWWHEAEPWADSVMRFFAGHAWCDVPAGDGAEELELTLLHALTGEALDGFQLSIDGEPVRPVHCEPVTDGQRLIYRLVPSPARGLRLAFHSPFADCVSRLHPSSADHRRLSLAVVRPLVRGAAAQSDAEAAAGARKHHAAGTSAAPGTAETV